jgi:hypothetical protein
MWPSWFAAKKKLSKLTLKEIRYEEKRLEIRENQLASSLEASEKERDEIFHQGAKTRSPSRRRIYARRFSQLSQRSLQTERELMRVGKELLTVGRLRAILERKDGPGGGVLEKLREEDMVKLASLLEDDRITEEIYLQKLDATLGVVNDPAYASTEIGQEGLEVLKTWEQMDEGELEFDQGLKRASESERSGGKAEPKEPEAADPAD